MDEFIGRGTPKRLMGSSAVVVASVVAQVPLQLEHVTAADVLEKLDLKGHDHPFDDAVGPGASVRGPPLLDVLHRHLPRKLTVELAAAIVRHGDGFATQLVACLG
jgi:hypothetical protein